MRCLPALMLALLPLAGCVGETGVDEDSTAPAPSDTGSTAHSPSPRVSVSSGDGPLLQWQAHEGDAVLGFTASGADGSSCRLHASYRPGEAPGWDGIVLVTRGEQTDWMVTGTTWSDAVVRAGPVDSHGIVPAHRDDGPIDLGWEWDGGGDVAVLVGARATRPGDVADEPGFAARLVCDGRVEVRDVMQGDRLLILSWREPGGTAVVVGTGPLPAPPLDAGAYAVSAQATFTAPVSGFVGSLGMDVAIVDVDGPDGPWRHTALPSLDPPPVARLAGPAGDYTARIAGALLGADTWLALAGLAPASPVQGA